MLNSLMILGTSSFNGKWVKDVYASQFTILGDCLKKITSTVVSPFVFYSYAGGP